MCDLFKPIYKTLLPKSQTEKLRVIIIRIIDSKGQWDVKILHCIIYIKGMGLFSKYVRIIE
ncbi:MAG: hypothetical protein A3J37_04030 [Alphaproteobacteria bacterium RIFCSPHIGHO2_12_FULL_45_9]|nr:MAG: hypothetical protein A3B66_06360 [Alphaproteobacteria bacterium RIFCSPHIGHO2_02_FULL_46_13]OFW97594.1 MAG: hypothetical protein A3J37_04030 [Alphaproteobacteria bacterium RIFCSPHIGHO2_12_FULL_45_9]